MPCEEVLADMAKAGKDFTVAQWIEAFETIIIGIVCCNCGCTSKDWVEFEAA